MSIVSYNVNSPMLQGVAPRIVQIVSSDNLATVSAAGYLNEQGQVLQGLQVSPTDEIHMIYSYVAATNSGTFGVFTPSFSAGVITLVLFSNAGEVSLIGAAVNGNLPKFSGTTGDIADSGIAATSVIVSSNASGQTISASSASATPGTIRALVGSFTESATTMTSGNVVGVRGVVNCVGASGGFIYGVQGKIISTGTLSGSLWAPAVFGQLDVSAATINGAQVAAIWGDWGATGATATDLSGCRGIVFTNTTANVLNAQDYRYGNATYLLELAGAGGTLNYYAAAGTSAGSAGDATHCAAQQVIKIEINGVAAYIPVFTQNT